MLERYIINIPKRYIKPNSFTNSIIEMYDLFIIKDRSTVKIRVMINDKVKIVVTLLVITFLMLLFLKPIALNKLMFFSSEVNIFFIMFIKNNVKHNMIRIQNFSLLSEPLLFHRDCLNHSILYYNFCLVRIEQHSVH